MADERAPDTTGTEPITQPAVPDTVAEIDPDVAQLLGLRPADAGSLPTADELDGRARSREHRLANGVAAAYDPRGPGAGVSRVLEPLRGFQRPHVNDGPERRRVSNAATSVDRREAMTR